MEAFDQKQNGEGPGDKRDQPEWARALRVAV